MSKYCWNRQGGVLKNPARYVGEHLDCFGSIVLQKGRCASKLAGKDIQCLKEFLVYLSRLFMNL